MLPYRVLVDWEFDAEELGDQAEIGHSISMSE